MNAERSYSSSIDWLTIGIWGVLVFMGWTAIYATTYDPLEGFEWGMGTEYGKQMVFIGVSGVLALLILNTEGQFFTQFSFVIYAVFIFLLALVLVARVGAGGESSRSPKTCPARSTADGCVAGHAHRAHLAAT